MFCLIYLHPVSRFPADSHSRSPPADRRIAVLWRISAGCLAPSCAQYELLHIFSYALPQPWNVDPWSTMGKILMHLPIWRKNASWVSALGSHEGELKVTWFRTQWVQPQQHQPAASSDKGNIHFNMTVLVYVWYLYFSSKSLCLHPPSVCRPLIILQGHGIRKVTRWSQHSFTHTQCRVSNQLNVHVFGWSTWKTLRKIWRLVWNLTNLGLQLCSAPQ